MKHGITLVLMLTMATGCATIVTRTGFGTKVYDNPQTSESQPYPAVWLDGEMIRSAASDSGDTPRFTTAKMAALSIGVMLDTPVSFVFDTLCLPYDLWQYGRERKREVNRK